MLMLQASVATIFILVTAAGPAAADDAPNWLVKLRPTLVGFPYDAEAGLECERYPPSVSSFQLGVGFDDVAEKQMSVGDGRFVRDVLIEGEASAQVDYRHAGGEMCSKLTLVSLAKVREHFATPVPQWKERR